MISLVSKKLGVDDVCKFFRAAALVIEKIVCVFIPFYFLVSRNSLPSVAGRRNGFDYLSINF
jgi:hypothetical protein